LKVFGAHRLAVQIRKRIPHRFLTDDLRPPDARLDELTRNLALTEPGNLHVLRPPAIDRCDGRLERLLGDFDVKFDAVFLDSLRGRLDSWVSHGSRILRTA
jgi:hypothetical protein